MKQMPLLLLLSCAAAHAQPIYRCVDGAGRSAFQDQPCAVQSAAVVREPARAEAKLERGDETLRVARLLQPGRDRDREAAVYATSNRRCLFMQRIAALCGSDAGRFSCDAKGFHNELPAEGSVPPATAELERGASFKRQQCALQAAKGRL